MGMVLCYLSGVLVGDAIVISRTSTFSEVGYLMFLVTWLGTPDCFGHLPHWPARGIPEVTEAQPWPHRAQRALGTRGVAFLRGLLGFRPRERLSIPEAIDHPWLHPQRFRLGGRLAAATPFVPQGIMNVDEASQESVPQEPDLTGQNKRKRITSQAELRTWNKAHRRQA